MADAFSSALREFEQVAAEIGQLSERLESLERRREQLRKLLRNLGSGATSDTALGNEQLPQAIREVVDAVAELGGSARLADIAAKIAQDSNVVATRLRRAVTLKRLVREGHGKYRLLSADMQSIAQSAVPVSPSRDAESDQSS